MVHHRLHLRVDGNLPGRCIVQVSSGKSLPARAKVVVLKDADVGTGSAAVAGGRFQTVAFRSHGILRTGQVVTETRSDESGRFQIIGLRPGSYSVVATGRDTVGVSLLTVLPYEANMAKEKSFLNITMVSSAEDGQTQQEQEIVYPYAMEGEAIGVGGGAAGGGGGGIMSGLAGLAGVSGLAGLGGLGGGTPPATPEHP